MATPRLVALLAGTASGFMVAPIRPIWTEVPRAGTICSSEVLPPEPLAEGEMLVVDLSTHETPHAPLEYEDFSDRPDELRKELRRMIYHQQRLIANCERDEECAVEEVEEINARMRRLKNYLRIEEEDDFTSSLDFAVDPSRIEATEAEQLALAKAERKRSEVEAATRFLNILVEHRKAAVAMAWDDRRYAKRGALGYAPMEDLQA